MTGEYLHHLAVAHGSLMELETQMILARLGYLGEDDAEQALSQSGEVGRMLHGLMRSLRAVREQS
jgi:four helix bundle protein